MDRRTLMVGLASLLLLGAVAAGTLMFGKTASLRGTTYGEPYPIAPDFGLTRGDGSSFQLSELRGNVVLIFFGYTSCPDVCPTTMAELKLVMEKLGAQDVKRTRVVFVTVDPQRDTPQRVQEYVDHFSTSFIGLSGSQTDLEKIWQDYGVFRQDVPGASAAGYTVDHTARITVVDQQGNLRISFTFDAPADDIIHDIKLLLK